MSLYNGMGDVFQSTPPTWGATVLGRAGESYRILFQSTLPRGERPRRSKKKFGGIRYFNPRSRVGSDLIVFATPPLKLIFQSTLPRGERPRSLIEVKTGLKFQSTLPRGERPEPDGLLQVLHVISIHAPAWGATYLVEKPGRVEGYFNPRSRVGSDYNPLLCVLPVIHFNPRSRVGSDTMNRGYRDGQAISIHAPAWGATGVNCLFLLPV